MKHIKRFRKTYQDLKQHSFLRGTLSRFDNYACGIDT